MWGLLVNGCSRKERDATSASMFRIPAIDIVSSGEDWWTCCLMASALNRCPAIIDFEEWSLLAHATVGVLSDDIPICACLSGPGATCSRTNHWRRCAAISRSLLVKSPSGFESDTILASMSAGHGSLHTIGSMCFEPLSHAPPAPKPDAST